jgi:hypothetical protein
LNESGELTYLRLSTRNPQSLVPNLIHGCGGNRAMSLPLVVFALKVRGIAPAKPRNVPVTFKHARPDIVPCAKRWRLVFNPHESKPNPSAYERPQFPQPYEPFRLPVPVRRADYLFRTVAEVMPLMQDLPSTAVLLRPGEPAQSASATPETDEIAAAFHAEKSKLGGAKA